MNIHDAEARTTRRIGGLAMLSCIATLGACASVAPQHASMSRLASHVAATVIAPPIAIAPEVLAPCGGARVLFATTSAQLDDAARAALDSYASCTVHEPTPTLYIAGTTDPSGAERGNAVLSAARARAVADYLRAAGCRMDFEVRGEGAIGSAQNRAAWRLERAATISTTPPPRH